MRLLKRSPYYYFRSEPVKKIGASHYIAHKMILCME